MVTSSAALSRTPSDRRPVPVGCWRVRPGLLARFCQALDQAGFDTLFPPRGAVARYGVMGSLVDIFPGGLVEAEGRPAARVLRQLAAQGVVCEVQP